MSELWVTRSVAAVVPASAFCIQRSSRALSMAGFVLPGAARTSQPPGALLSIFLELIMKKLSVVLAVAGMATSMAAIADVPANLLGDPGTPEQAQRTIVITPTTKYV